jgi:hypothetical protein
MAAITPWTWSMDGGEIDARLGRGNAESSPDLTQWACLAAAIRALDGTQP